MTKVIFFTQKNAPLMTLWGVWILTADLVYTVHTNCAKLMVTTLGIFEFQ